MSTTAELHDKMEQARLRLAGLRSQIADAERAVNSARATRAGFVQTITAGGSVTPQDSAAADAAIRDAESHLSQLVDARQTVVEAVAAAQHDLRIAERQQEIANLAAHIAERQTLAVRANKAIAAAQVALAEYEAHDAQTPRPPGGDMMIRGQIHPHLRASAHFGQPLATRTLTFREDALLKPGGGVQSDETGLLDSLSAMLPPKAAKAGTLAK